MFYQPPIILGVLNLTPDSFSDGGKFFHPDTALRQVYELIEQGADYIDLGAESTRPGAQPVSPETEWSRLLPVLKAIKSSSLKNIQISIDTKNPSTAMKCLDQGVHIINNIDGLFDQPLLEKIARYGCSYLAMYMHGKSPKTMQEKPVSRELAFKEFEVFCNQTHQTLLETGFDSERIWLDPGVGFGKTDSANLYLIESIQQLKDKFQIALGVSRKSMFRRMLDIDEPIARDPVSKMTEYFACVLGAKMIRTHNVGLLCRLLKGRSNDL